MQSRTTLKRHAALVDDMARARGQDLEEEIMRGKMTMSELEDAVLRCTSCTSPDTCRDWLSKQAGPVPEAPDYCRNAALFRALDGG